MIRRVGFALTIAAVVVAVCRVGVAANGGSGPTPRLPPVNGRLDYQIGGAYRPGASVQIVDRDRTARPAAGVYNICYMNAFQTQPEADHWWRRHYPGLLLRGTHGRLVEDPGWPGEYLLDTGTRHDRHRLAMIEDRWIDRCARRGFDAVEADNLDSYSRSRRKLSAHDNRDFARLLSARAHHDGLAIAQKNDAEHSASDRRTAHFDFAIAEECQVYRECQDYSKAYGAHMVEIEYTDNGRRFYRRACAARGGRISVILRDRGVVPRHAPGYVYRAC